MSVLVSVINFVSFQNLSKFLVIIIPHFLLLCYLSSHFGTSNFIYIIAFLKCCTIFGYSALLFKLVSHTFSLYFSFGIYYWYILKLTYSFLKLVQSIDEFFKSIYFCYSIWFLALSFYSFLECPSFCLHNPSVLACCLLFSIGNLNTLTIVILNVLCDNYKMCIASESSSDTQFGSSSLSSCFLAWLVHVLLKGRCNIPANSVGSLAVFNICCNYRCQGLCFFLVSLFLCPLLSFDFPKNSLNRGWDLQQFHL